MLQIYSIDLESFYSIYNGQWVEYAFNKGVHISVIDLDELLFHVEFRKRDGDIKLQKDEYDYLDRTDELRSIFSIVLCVLKLIFTFLKISFQQYLKKMLIITRFLFKRS